jgi:hypothetical protein
MGHRGCTSDDAARTKIMTMFNMREQGFETKFVFDEEVRFKAMARRNRLLGHWAAGRLGLSGDDAVAYANDLVTADLDKRGDTDVLHRVSKDLAQQGVSEQEVAQKMAELFNLALEQIGAGV